MENYNACLRIRAMQSAFLYCNIPCIACMAACVVAYSGPPTLPTFHPPLASPTAFGYVCPSMALFSPELESAVASDGYASFAHYAIVGHDSVSFSSDPLPCGRCFQLHYLPQAGSAHCYSSLGQCGYGAASGQDTSSPPAKDLIVQVVAPQDCH